MISLRSSVTKKILSYFFINPHENLYVNELSRKLNLDKRNLVKKIKQFEVEGILTREARGNLKLYSINKKYLLYDEYRKIIMATIGLQGSLKTSLQHIKGIKHVYVYGSYAKDNMDAHSDIDLLVVGDENTLSLHKAISKLQKEFGREINVVDIDESEFKKKIKQKNPFITDILKQKHIKII